MLNKYSDSRKYLSKKTVDLYINPLLFAVFSIYYKCSLHEKCPYRRTPKNFVWDALFISWLLILSFGSLSGESSAFLGLWYNEYFVLFNIQRELIWNKPVVDIFRFSNSSSSLR